MKSLSIKIFTLGSILFIIFGVIIAFFNFYQNTKSNLAELLTNHIQTESLNIKHYLDDNLKNNNLSGVISHLDNLTSISNTIRDIHILDENHKLLYSRDRSEQILSPEECLNVSKINANDIFENDCYSFSIKLYHNLEPYYFSSHIYVDKTYINNLLNQQIIKISIIFSLFALIFFIILWFSLKKIIVTPLEELRQFAYYSTVEPKEFFISEIESIRYSLALTFARLKQEQEELYQLSTKDQLSGLYNRMSLMEKIEWLISNKNRKNETFAIVFLDLDNFKDINDSMGHNFGDKVLQKVSAILLNSVRENDIVSRIGGDEFVLVLPDLENETRVVDILDRIKKQLLIPIDIEQHKFTITASMGVSFYPQNGKNVHTLLKHADIAMYKSKELGKNVYHFFTNQLNKTIQEKVAMQNLMIEALEHNYFQLYYQPKTDIQTGKIVACEALIRLIDPEKGLISPDKFIPLAEESNFIIQLGKWVIDESVRQIALWSKNELQNLKVSINVSAKQFKEDNLVQTLQNAIIDIDKSRLDIELTESVFVNDFEKTYNTIEQIKALGLTLSLDDFGTGYSSLSYLKKIPFDTIKIDKSFIDDLESNHDQSFVGMIIDISKKLHLEIVAEGVETVEQLTYLKEMKCDIYQGYLCSKPLPANEFEALVKSNNSL